MNRIKTIIADDHQMFLDGLHLLLSQNEEFEVVGLANNGQQVMELLRRNSVEIAVLDIEMPLMDGLQTTLKIREQYPEIKILILSMHKKAAHITQMLEAGASGYILKENGRQELLVALQAICQGKQYFGQAVTQELIRGIRTLAQNPKAILTKREKEIIILIANGKTTPEIAEQLFIAESTVNTHRRNIIEKLGVGNIKGLVKYATQNGYC